MAQHLTDPFLLDLANLSDSSEEEQPQLVAKDQLEKDLIDEVDGAAPATVMIDTGKVEAEAELDSAVERDRIFSRLRVDEKFLAHLDAVKQNLQVSDEELSKKAQQTNADMTQQVFDLISSTNEFLRQLQPEI